MTALFVLQTALAHTINADPVLCLAHAAAWLDPLRGDTDDMDLSDSEDDTVFVALHILRRAFPDIYFDALQAIRQGASYPQLDQLICGAVQAQGIPLENLEWIGSGIPLPAYGATLDDPEFYTTHPAVLPLLECFGITPEANPYNMVIPEVTYKVADRIADDLLKEAEDYWRQVGWLLKYLMSSTGNSSCDLDHETMSEIQPLSWDADNIAFAREIIEEADGIMGDALAGLAFLTSQTELMNALQHNVRRVYKVLAKSKGKSHEPRLRLAWPHLTDGAERIVKPVGDHGAAERQTG